MPELVRIDAGVILCAADAAALDALVPPGYGSRALRTAPDEVLFVCEPSIAHDVAREVRDRVAALDEDAVVLDVTDGWRVRGSLGTTPAAPSRSSRSWHHPVWTTTSRATLPGSTRRCSAMQTGSRSSSPRIGDTTCARG